MGDRPSSEPDPTGSITQGTSGAFADLSLKAIEADPDQPRKVFAPTEIASLAESLQTHGLLEPVVVHQLSSGSYQLIAGERRLRAATQLGWKTIPAIIRSAHAQSNLILALVENLQREDLTALDEAHAYHRLKEDHQLTQDRIAQLVGKRRATVANALRLLSLGETARNALANGLIDKGHARALLAISDTEIQDVAVTRCVKEGWSVRATENFAKNQKRSRSGGPESTRARKAKSNEDYSALSSAIGLDVDLSGRKITLRAGNREEALLFLARLTRMVRGAQGMDQKGSS
jgi:ParB family transcriptional regulator, chromosome partitioning protein